MDCDVIKTDVTVVKFYKNFILAGIGNYLHVYRRCDLSLWFKRKIFDGQKIHNIHCDDEPFIIYGGRELCTFNLNVSEKYKEENFVQNISHIAYDDWILDATLNEGDNEIITISAHNKAVGTDFKDHERKWEKSCDISSILYGATIARKDGEFFILAGTVFSEILIWSPKISTRILYRLTGHEGVIFSITWNARKTIICSTSDDRTVRLWKVNFNSDIDTQQIEIKPKITMYGHTARVMRAKILSNYIISIGEDSLINIWDHDGNHIRKIEAHQNDCIWSLDCDETYNQLITGGGDAGICLHAIKEDIRKHIISCPFDVGAKNVFKKISFINESNIVIVTESGKLLHFNCNAGIKTVAELKGLKKILLEVSPDKAHIAVAGFQNEIHIYHLVKCELRKEKDLKIDQDHSILTIHWLSESEILVCDDSGALKIFNTTDETIAACGTLPKIKERWTTAACKYNQCVIVGDRGGNIHLYESKYLHQSLHKVHGRLGIACLKLQNSLLITTGRDGKVKRFKVNEATKRLEVFSTIKLPFKWCADVFMGHSLVIGFLEFNFVLYNMNLHRKIFEYNCGGGHRSWDFYVLDKNHFKFIFIKDKYVHELTFATDNLRDLEQGFHSHEINQIIPIRFDNQLITVSGGEDTTLKVAKYSPSSLKVISTHNFHLSSIRCLHPNRLTDTDVLIYSAGGRAQLVLSKLTYADDTVEFDCILTHSLKLNTKADPETRIMDVTSFPVDASNFILFAACSDGSLRVLRYKYDENSLQLVFSSNYHKCCITKVCLISTQKLIILSMGTNGKILFWDFSPLLITTDKIQNIVPFYEMKIHQSAINCFSAKNIDTNIFLLVSGGDDCKINLCLIEFTANESKVQVLSNWSAENFFCSQVTGLIIIDQYLFACSTDQRLTVCELLVSENEIECKFVKQRCLTVSDLLGMCDLSAPTEDSYVIGLYGKGIEVLRINKTCFIDF